MLNLNVSQDKVYDHYVYFNGLNTVYVGMEDYGAKRDIIKLLEKTCGKDVRIENGTVIILKSLDEPIHIGDNAHIGANCTIKKDVPANAVIEHGTVWQ